MVSVTFQLIEEVTAHAQSNSLEDAREICADGTYFPNILRIYSQVTLRQHVSTVNGYLRVNREHFKVQFFVVSYFNFYCKRNGIPLNNHFILP